MMGEEVTVLSSRETGRDAMGEPTVEWQATVVPGCLVRPLAGSDAGDAVRPEGIVASYSIAFPKTYAGPPLARCRIALTGRGMPADPDTALLVVGSPDITNPCPTAWNMTATAGRAHG
ncbi:MAG: hypothetical protein UDF83_02720 [Collinsella stercoris]|nr:hypothetical protein [Collinsella stercoris]